MARASDYASLTILFRDKTKAINYQDFTTWLRSSLYFKQNSLPFQVDSWMECPAYQCYLSTWESISNAEMTALNSMSDIVLIVGI